MIREVHPNLFVGDGNAPDGDLKRLAGYEPGHNAVQCEECGAFALQNMNVTRLLPYRCLDCTLKHIAENWFIIHAAKEPWHRDALGYTGRGAPPDHPEYLVAHRPGQLILNLVDMPKLQPKYTDPIFDAALEAISDNLSADLEHGKRVLVHCNEGKSRAPTIALLYLGEQDDYQGVPFDVAVDNFRQMYYPEYEPGAGVEAYARQRWGFVEEPAP
jgi:hypothetical protein